MSSEWIKLPSGENLHKTTIDCRRSQLGWSSREAKSTPVRPYRGKHGRPNISARARADIIAPVLARQVMSKYGISYELARDHIQRGGR